MLPSGMDGLERAALTEKSQGDASRRPGRRSFSAPAGGQGGVGGGVSSWHLLTPSALTLWKFIVAVVVVRSCCAALKMHNSVSLDVVVQFPTVGERRKTGVVERTRAKDGIMWRKERKGGGTGLFCGCSKTFSTLRFTRQLNILCIAAL